MISSLNLVKNLESLQQLTLNYDHKSPHFFWNSITPHQALASACEVIRLHAVVGRPAKPWDFTVFLSPFVFAQVATWHGPLPRVPKSAALQPDTSPCGVLRESGLGDGVPYVTWPGIRLRRRACARTDWLGWGQQRTYCLSKPCPVDSVHVAYPSCQLHLSNEGKIS